jgi:flavin reductase (DIM6/NTAB) family NADH-FMN oxidoreductase RutF
MQFTSEDIQLLDDRFRRNLINSLHGAKSIGLVGTIDANGLSNLAIFSQIFHIGANPPLIGMLVRPDSVDRHTLHNIQAQGTYTIQHIKESYYKKAHQTSARYPKEVSEFQELGLNEAYIGDFPAPFLEDAELKIGLKLRSTQTLQENGTVLVIGEVVLIDVANGAISADGFIDPQILGTIAGGGLDAYYKLEKLSRLNYAKPNLPAQELSE